MNQEQSEKLSAAIARACLPIEVVGFLLRSELFPDSQALAYIRMRAGDSEKWDSLYFLSCEAPRRALMELELASEPTEDQTNALFHYCSAFYILSWALSARTLNELSDRIQRVWVKTRNPTWLERYLPFAQSEDNAYLHGAGAIRSTLEREATNVLGRSLRKLESGNE